MRKSLGPLLSLADDWLASSVEREKKGLSPAGNAETRRNPQKGFQPSRANLSGTSSEPGELCCCTGTQIFQAYKFSRNTQVENESWQLMTRALKKPQKDRQDSSWHCNATLQQHSKNAYLSTLTHLLQCCAWRRVTIHTLSKKPPLSNWAPENEFFSRCHPIISCILVRLNNRSRIRTRWRNTPSSWHLKSQPEHMISHSLPTCKFDVELVLGLENLDVEGAIRSKVFHCPGSEDGLMILRKLETVLDSV